MNIDFEKGGGLVPAIIQDEYSGTVLMLGFMNREAFEKTTADGYVTFFSRTKQRLWRKGETSGNRLKVISLSADCDSDALLVKVKPEGVVCHTGSFSCFDNHDIRGGFINTLGSIIDKRASEGDSKSYTVRLLAEGVKRTAQKLGEEAVELAIEAQGDNNEAFLNEAADLVYHLLVLLKSKGATLAEVEKVLEKRHR
jgi:phosphoribosyl-ATP pyrophosphohydrolase/phosphoribosyl-AMP cyclohydrolase